MQVVVWQYVAKRHQQPAHRPAPEGGDLVDRPLLSSARVPSFAYRSSAQLFSATRRLEVQVQASGCRSTSDAARGTSVLPDREVDTRAGGHLDSKRWSPGSAFPSSRVG